MARLDHVNIKQGTDSTSLFSQGNTLPLTKRPFGMSAFAPQTTRDANFYHPHHRSLHGVRLTHQPSPWVNDFASLLFQPQRETPASHPDSIWSGYRPEDAVLTPAYQELDFLRARAKLRLTASDRAAIMLLDFHETVTIPRLAILPKDAETKIILHPEKNQIEGYTRFSTHPTADNFALYFVMDIRGAIDRAHTETTTNDGRHQTGTHADGNGAGLNVGFAEKKIEIRLGFSFISIEQAWINLRRELGERSFDEIRREGEAIWEAQLAKIDIEADDATLDTFYSCMYRLFLYPTRMDEFDANMQRIHYSPYSGETHPGPAYTNNGFWDTFRTVYPLYSIIDPERYADILEGYVNAYRESGWLPKWPSPAETGIMPGTLIDAVIADAAVKGIGSRDMLETALEGAIKHSITDAHDERIGRRGVTEYLELGYVPKDKFHESVNRSLDYIYGDYCIGRTAEVLGRHELIAPYAVKAQNYKKLYDAETGFMRGRTSSGDFSPTFDPFEWGGDYTEGSAWQNSLAVYHDFDGLIELMGGTNAFAEHLDRLFAAEPLYGIGSYWGEIHEMTEMAAVDFGQFAISNQPSFHIPYLYVLVGQREKAVHWIRRACSELFSANPAGFPGDEDNGSTSGWYILSMLGFYQLCPGKAEYVIASPLVESASIQLGSSGRRALISRDSDGCFVLNGKRIESTYLSHEQLISES